MKWRYLLLTLALCLAWPVHAADVRTYAQVTIDNTSGGVALPGTLTRPSGLPAANHCLIRLETAEIRYRVDGGAPTTTVGTPLEPLEIIQLDSGAEILAFLGIRTGASSGTLNAACWN